MQLCISHDPNDFFSGLIQAIALLFSYSFPKQYLEVSTFSESPYDALAILRNSLFSVTSLCKGHCSALSLINTCMKIASSGQIRVTHQSRPTNFFLSTNITSTQVFWRLGFGMTVFWPLFTTIKLLPSTISIFLSLTSYPISDLAIYVTCHQHRTSTRSNNLPPICYYQVITCGVIHG